MAETSEDHYFSADPKAPFKRLRVEAQAWGRPLSFTTGSGVFAHGRLDIGTSVLFKETEPPAGGRILDLGCGSGVIGLAIASAWAAAGSSGEVVGVDVNERAVLLANENAAALRLPAFTAYTPGRVPEGAFDEIWSNPPIRIGKPALHALLLEWFARLTPDGRAVMVVGKNLGADSLQRWLGEQGYPTARIGSAKGFRVLESRPSRPAV